MILDWNSIEQRSNRFPMASRHPRNIADCVDISRIFSARKGGDRLRMQIHDPVHARQADSRICQHFLYAIRR
jgi:hypothetical protein